MKEESGEGERENGGTRREASSSWNAKGEARGRKSTSAAEGEVRLAGEGKRKRKGALAECERR